MNPSLCNLVIARKRRGSVSKPVSIVTLETRRELEPKCVSQLKSFLGTHRSAIGNYFLLPLVTIPEVFAIVNSTQFLSGF